jgi:hypothetical protein
MSSKKHPTKDFVKDLAKVFNKHNWSGNAIGIAMSTASSANITATGEAGCAPGTSPQVIKYQLPDGTWVSKTVCV